MRVRSFVAGLGGGNLTILHPVTGPVGMFAASSIVLHSGLVGWPGTPVAVTATHLGPGVDFNWNLVSVVAPTDGSGDAFLDSLDLPAPAQGAPSVTVGSGIGGGGGGGSVVVTDTHPHWPYVLLGFMTGKIVNKSD